jgi:hypothetical protein
MLGARHCAGILADGHRDLGGSPVRASRRRPSASVLILCCAAAAAVAASTFTAPRASAWTHTIHVDQRRAFTTIDQLVPEIERTCQTSEQVTVAVRTRFGRFGRTFNCDARTTGDSVSVGHQLAQAAARQNRAAVKADRAIALDQELTPDMTFGRDELIWGLAAGNGRACKRAKRPAEIRKQMASASRATGETPEHWTLLEAAYVGGVCPQRLSALFENVARIGQPDAAAAAERLVKQAMRT